jgi:uncharacterized RDD family membrane protein YckC
MAERPPREPGRRGPVDPIASRLLRPGVRAGERIAGAAGIDQVVEDAIVRAIGSGAVDRAIVRVAEEGALQQALERALTEADMEDVIRRAIDSEAADRIWEEILASAKAQMLVERIAEAPEVRAAIAEQGIGLVSDLGRRVTRITEALDDAVERVAHKLFVRDGHPEAETNQVGLITRGLAFAIDIGLLVGAFSIVSGLLASIGSALFGSNDDGVSAIGVVSYVGVALIIGGSIFATLWALVGQTPGMRFLGIRLDVDGEREIGMKRAIKRVFAIPLAVIPFGLGLLGIVISPRRRALQDVIAGTEVVYDDRHSVAPWSQAGAGASRRSSERR